MTPVVCKHCSSAMEGSRCLNPICISHRAARELADRLATMGRRQRKAALREQQRRARKSPLGRAFKGVASRRTG